MPKEPHSQGLDGCIPGAVVVPCRQPYEVGREGGGKRVSAPCWAATGTLVLMDKVLLSTERSIIK